PTSVAVIFVAPLITWLFVITSPPDVTTIPVPAASPPCNPRTVLMSTRPGSTFEVIELETLSPEPPLWPGPASSPALPSPNGLPPSRPSPGRGNRYGARGSKLPDGPKTRLDAALTRRPPAAPQTKWLTMMPAMAAATPSSATRVTPVGRRP